MTSQDFSKPRASVRKKLFMPVEASFLSRPIRLHLLDISHRGALAHCQSPLAIGTIIRLTIGEYTSLARIQWQREERIGLELSQPIGDDIIERAFAMPVQAQTQRPPVSA